MQSEISKQTGLVLNFKCYKDNKHTQSTAQQIHTPTYTHGMEMSAAQPETD